MSNKSVLLLLGISTSVLKATFTTEQKSILGKSGLRSGLREKLTAEVDCLESEVDCESGLPGK